MRVLIPFLLCSAAFAQPHALALDGGSARPGGTVTLPLRFTPVGSQPAGLQWTFIYPASGILSVSVQPGPVAFASAKAIACAGSGGTYTCLAAGINTNTIAGGILAYAVFTLAPSVTMTSIGVHNTLGATLAGDDATTVGTGGTVVAFVPGDTHVRGAKLKGLRR